VGGFSLLTKTKGDFGLPMYILAQTPSKGCLIPRLCCPATFRSWCDKSDRANPAYDAVKSINEHSRRVHKIYFFKQTRHRQSINNYNHEVFPLCHSGLRGFPRRYRRWRIVVTFFAQEVETPEQRKFDPWHTWKIYHLIVPGLAFRRQLADDILSLLMLIFLSRIHTISLASDQHMCGR